MTEPTTAGYLLCLRGTPASAKNGNRIIINRATGRRSILKSARAESYGRSAVYQAQLQWREPGTGRRLDPLAGRLGVALTLYMGDERRRDLDNMVASVLDVLTAAGVWEDDSQVWELDATKRLDRETPRAEIRVWPLTPGGPP